MPGVPLPITFYVTNHSGADVYLKGWIDWDNDGQFSSITDELFPEQVFHHSNNAPPELRTIYIQNPTSIPIFSFIAYAARFRLSSISGESFSNQAGSVLPLGEVEDYFSTKQPDDGGVGPVPQKACIDDPTRLQYVPLVAGSAPAIRYHWTSDPPGFNSYLPNPVAAPKQSTTYHVVVSKTDGGQVFDDAALQTDSCDYGDAPQGLYIVSHPSPNMYVAEQFDYHTTISSGGAGHLKKFGGVFLGSEIDYEINGQPLDLFATGDDMNPHPDDEDGVTGDPGKTCNYSICQQITAHGSGYLNAWVDFNFNNSWEPGEQVYNNVPLNNGANAVSFPIPAAAHNGTTFARYRFTEGKVQTPSPDGFADNGEVEDHQITIESGSSQNLLIVENFVHFQVIQKQLAAGSIGLITRWEIAARPQGQDVTEIILPSR